MREAGHRRPSKAKKARPRRPRRSSRNFFYPRLGPGQMWETDRRRRFGKSAATCFLTARSRPSLGRDRRHHITSAQSGGRVFPAGVPTSSPPSPSGTDCCPRPAGRRKSSPAARPVRYPGFITVCLIVNREKVFPDTWIYITTRRSRSVVCKITRTGARHGARIPSSPPWAWKFLL